MMVFQGCREEKDRDTVLPSLRELGLQEPEIVLEETLALLGEKKLLIQEERPNFDRRRFLAAAGSWT